MRDRVALWGPEQLLGKEGRLMVSCSREAQEPGTLPTTWVL